LRRGGRDSGGGVRLRGYCGRIAQRRRERRKKKRKERKEGKEKEKNKKRVLRKEE